jgi:hypothetical protein
VTGRELVHGGLALGAAALAFRPLVARAMDHAVKPRRRALLVAPLTTFERHEAPPEHRDQPAGFRAESTRL